jgi:predicted RNase H-like nuclease
MTPERQRRLLETHPELVFRRLNDNQPLARKKSREGRSQRIELLNGQGVSRIEKWLGQRYGTGIGRDDLIDAGVCAIAARDSMDRLPRGEPPIYRGIRAEMWY